jgi:dihydropyrimidine dehydrogenase (NAD+) subunit PreT
MAVSSKLTNEQYAQNFADINPALTEDAARDEANRCLFCYDAPCTKACPTHIDVASFIKKIATKNLKGSARVILESNILGYSCARVCPVEVLCEGACVYNEKKESPISIALLQRHSTDYVFDKGFIQHYLNPVNPMGKRLQ